MNYRRRLNSNIKNNNMNLSIRGFLGLLGVLLHCYQDNILKNPQNKEMYISSGDVHFVVLGKNVFLNIERFIKNVILSS